MKKHPLKKRLRAIFVSVIVHLVVFGMLFFVAEKQQPKPINVTQKAIKSYLYKMPLKAEKIEPIPIKKEQIEKLKPALVKKEESQKVVEQKKLAVAKSAIEVTPKVESFPERLPKPKSAPKSTTSVKTQKPMQATFSAYKQLDSLRSAINKKIIAQEFSELQQFRSPSIMHGEQVAVPHSNKQLTPEQERDKNTTKMSDSISITKYDNGICTLEREQFLGSPVEGSSAAFACGESKFDKSFREHMRKVNDKLMPAKNK